MTRPKSDYVAVFLVAFIASAGGNYGSSFFRADRYTGTQGTALEQKVNTNAADIKSLKDGLPPKWLIDRIDRIETKLDRLLHKLEK